MMKVHAEARTNTYGTVGPGPGGAVRGDNIPMGEVYGGGRGSLLGGRRDGRPVRITRVGGGRGTNL